MNVIQDEVDAVNGTKTPPARRTRIDAPHEPARNAVADTMAAANGTPARPVAIDFQGAETALLEVEEPTAEMVAAVMGENIELRREQLQLQVAQLAAHLRQRLREVDRREAAVNARLAQLECDLRTNKLWLGERELAFQERENELQRQIEELQEKADVCRVEEEKVTHDAESAEAVAAELAERERQIELREDDVRERRFDVDRQGAALCHSQQVWQHEREKEEANLAAERARFEHDAAQWQQQFEREMVEKRQQLVDELAGQRDELAFQRNDLTAQQDGFERQIADQQAQLAQETAHTREQLQSKVAAAKQELEKECNERRELLEHDFEQRITQREGQIEAAEAMLNEQSAAIERDRAALYVERRDWDEQNKRQRQAIDELRQATEGELADRQTRLEARQEWIERQKSGLEQVRDETLKLHRQSLEMRLVTEQVWSQITATRSPAELTQSIASARLQLSEQYRMEEQQLVARRDELLELTEKIAHQHRELVQLRDGVRDWGLARQKEIERQAGALAERESALDAQHEKLRDRENEWNTQRREYDRQIREFNARLRSMPQAA
ncbi:MAG TPA: hypothetical protein VGI40_06080 [Pirellulaceae bacterium]|jgi:hypothetical protein